MSFIRGIFMSRKLTQFTYARSGEVLKSSHIQVYVNKFIFEDPAFKRCPSSFVAYHFAITGAMLYVASRPQVALFTAAPASAISVLPLAAIMCANVVLVNLSLAFSSIVCYQIVLLRLSNTVLGNVHSYSGLCRRWHCLILRLIARYCQCYCQDDLCHRRDICVFGVVLELPLHCVGSTVS
jgi:hypothetical protein